jgi:hypothetical protein
MKLDRRLPCDHADFGARFIKDCRKLGCRCSASDDGDVAAFESAEIDMSGAVRQQIRRKHRQL